jgi:hypothetical protein
MRIEERLPWRNVGQNQSSIPRLSFWPESVEDLRDIVLRAEREGTTVRAVGSAHSWSDVAKTDDFLVYTKSLKRVLSLDDYQLRADLPTPRDRLVRVECGLTVRELNDVLARQGRALFNMGSFDGQAICGAMATSTHGSGISLGPMCDFIRSLEIVASAGKLYRIEPSPASGRALTDPTAFALAYPDPDRYQLVQDDGWFAAAIVNLGCFGLMAAVVLEVRPAFLLKETRSAANWRDVAETLRNGGIRRTPTHYDLILSPYNLFGHNRCLVTTRTETEIPGDRQRAIFVRYRAVLELSAWYVKLLTWIWPRKLKLIHNAAIDLAKDDDYTDQSFKVLNLGDANLIPVLSTEIGVPVEGDTYLAAIDRVLEVLEELAREERLFVTVPLGIRFVRATQALLSPMHERDTCMIEIVTLRGITGYERLLARIERELQAFGGRPHWAKLNHVTPERLHQMYGTSYARWLRVHAVLNAKGTFSGPFTRRVGLGQP